MIPFFDAYAALIAWAIGSGSVETNARTGTKIKVIRGGVSIRIDLKDGILPTVGFRKTFPKSAAAEIAWYLQGQQDATFIRKYAPLWDKFVEPIPYDVNAADPYGMTPESLSVERVLVQPLGGESYYAQGNSYFEGVKAAYGYRWRHHFGRDQIDLAIEALKADPTDRRVFISAWDPAEDGLGATGQRNVPCPATFSLSIQEGELHSTLTLRSSDLFVGLPYDVMGHALLMDAIAHELRIRPGVMMIALAHAHLYECHWEMASAMLMEEPVLPDLVLPGWSLSQILRDPDDYVLRYAEEAKALTWPTFNPKPAVVE